MANKPRLRGSNSLLSVDTYNSCFASYFGITAIDILSMSKHCESQLIYYYGLRRLCGLSVRDASLLLGFPNSFAVSFGLKYCCKKLCLFDDSYSADFVNLWVGFRKYCRVFRKPMTAKERYAKWYAKQSNKKKRAKKK